MGSFYKIKSTLFLVYHISIKYILLTNFLLLYLYICICKGNINESLEKKFLILRCVYGKCMVNYLLESELIREPLPWELGCMLWLWMLQVVEDMEHWSTY